MSNIAVRQHINLSLSRHCASAGLQDVVCHEGKLFRLYKRPGQRVIIDAAGRMIVRPTHLEAAVQRESSGRSNGALFSNRPIYASLACVGGGHCTYLHLLLHVKPIDNITLQERLSAVHVSLSAASW